MTNTIKRQNFIDFRQSKIKWITKEYSEAFFSIESICYEKNNDTNWYLSSSVLAGNVYSKTSLPKIPMYHFTWAFSKNKTIIFRQFVDYQNNTQHGNDLFKIAEIICKYVQPNEIVSFDQLSKAYDSNHQFFATTETDDLLLTFPIKHLNIHKRKKLFQVETGPVLFINENDYIPAFLHFNNFYSIYISFNYPNLSNTFINKNSHTSIYYY